MEYVRCQWHIIGRLKRTAHGVYRLYGIRPAENAGLFFGQGLIHMDECAKIRFIRTGHEAIPMTPQKLYEKEKT